MADESRQDSNIFGFGAVCVRCDAEPIPMPLGNQRQTVYGGVTLYGQTCCMAADKANDRSFIRYLDKLQRRFGKIAVMVDNAASTTLGASGDTWKKRRFRQTDVPAAVFTVFESGQVAVAQRQDEDTAHFQATG